MAGPDSNVIACDVRQNEANKFQCDVFGNTAANTKDIYTKITSMTNVIDNLTEGESYDFVAYDFSGGPDNIKMFYLFEGAFIFRLDLITVPAIDSNGDECGEDFFLVNKITDAPALTGVTLLPEEVPQGSEVGKLVGTLLAIGGTSPIVFQISNDPDNFFEIVNGNELRTTQLASEQTTHLVTITATDSLLDAVSNTFSIEITDPPDITNLALSNSTVIDGAAIGTVIGTFVVAGGIQPYTFTITADPSDKFDISGSELITDNAVDIADVSYSVTVEVEDVNNDTFEETLIITVVSAFVNVFSLDLTGGGTPHIVAPNVTGELDLDRADPVTYSFWVNRTNTAGSDTVFSNIDSGSNNNQGTTGYFDGNGANRFNFHINNSGGNQMRSRYTVGAGELGNWILMVVAYDGSSLNSGVTCWSNAVSLTQNDLEDGLTLDNVNGEDLAWGARLNGSQGYNGLLDQIVIWDVEFDQTMVDELYNSGTPIDVRLHSEWNNKIRGYNLEEDTDAIEGIPAEAATEVNSPAYSVNIP